MKQQYLSPKSISIHICSSELLAQSPLDGAEVSVVNVDIDTSAGILVGEDNESGEGLN